MGKLTTRDMDQLEQWIGTGPKTFTLLYSIMQHGCDSQTFHDRCDDQGPTVTVLYNQQGSVYGGYAGISWQSSNIYQCDHSAFLFKLYLNGNTDAVKFDRNCEETGIYDDEDYGPSFGSDAYKVDRVNEETAIFDYKSYRQTHGSDHVLQLKRKGKRPIRRNPHIERKCDVGNDLETFRGIINNSYGYFHLNGSMNIGKSFNSNAQNQQWINNGNMVVTELEVYTVSDGERKPGKPMKPAAPWRKTPVWNDKLLNSLEEDIVAYKGVPDVNISEANVLLIGPVGAGKSSFFNTINSIFRGRITQKAGSGSVAQSLTTTYTQYRIRTQTGTNLNFRLCDTRGLEENQGLDILELNYLLEGHVRDFYQFNPASPITPDSTGFVKNPPVASKMHCVAFAVDASTLDVMPAKILKKMRSFQTMINQRGIPQVMLLSKVDKLSTGVEADISTVFTDDKVGDTVEKASQVIGLPRTNILPVKNYENEIELDDNISILALFALRQILNFAEDHMENIAEKVFAEKKAETHASKE